MKRRQGRLDNAILITGFDGMIAQRLVTRLVESYPNARISLLTGPRCIPAVESGTRALIATHPQVEHRLEIISGDITTSQLGLPTTAYEEVAAECGMVFHLEELCDSAASPRAHARVNVNGTINILDFCHRAQVDRLFFLSTVYVAGKRTGTVFERELNEGQGFSSVFEETKCRAEIEVRKRMDVIPTTIIRPSIIVGDSRTGVPHRYCGPYKLIKWLADLERRNLLPKGIPLPFIGTGKNRLHLVPIDYLVKIIAALPERPESTGLTYQVIDPNALRARDLYTLILRKFGLRLMGAIPEWMVSVPLWLPPFNRWTAPLGEIVPYLNHHADFDGSNTAALAEAEGIICPRIESYLDVLIDYVRTN